MASASPRPAFRRRILIEPRPSQVTAELEDDWHRMVVTLRHEEGVVRAVSSDMKRWPWTTCPGATAQLETTFVGQALSNFAKCGEKNSNCTHLYDLALFAAAHAVNTEPVRYDIIVFDPQEGRRDARLARNGETVLSWRLADVTFVEPADIAGMTLFTLGGWIASLDKPEQEPARILRWASIMALGRAMVIPAGLSAEAFAGGACFTFQAAKAGLAQRRPNAHQDFSASGPLSEHAHLFGEKWPPPYLGVTVNLSQIHKTYVNACARWRADSPLAAQAETEAASFFS